MIQGRFIVLEGIDGCGSTTQARRLANVLSARGQRVALTFEPTDGPIGLLIRRALRRTLEHDGQRRELDWAAMALLFAADRLDHVASTVRPALEAGAWVISDRYDLSSLAYQSVTATEPTNGTVEWLRTLNTHALRPDLTVVLDVPFEVAEERRRARGGEPELYEVSELQRRLSAVYATAEALVPGDPLLHVDGSLSPDAVGERILACVDAPTLG